MTIEFGRYDHRVRLAGPAGRGKCPESGWWGAPWGDQPWVGFSGFDVVPPWWRQPNVPLFGGCGLLACSLACAGCPIVGVLGDGSKVERTDCLALCPGSVAPIGPRAMVCKTAVHVDFRPRGAIHDHPGVVNHTPRSKTSTSRPTARSTATATDRPQTPGAPQTQEQLSDMADHARTRDGAFGHRTAPLAAGEFRPDRPEHTTTPPNTKALYCH